MVTKMGYFVVALLLTIPCYSWAGSQEIRNVVGMAKSAGGGAETIGTATQGATMLITNNDDLIYLYPISGTFSASGTLTSYHVTMRQQNGSRLIKLALYTLSGTTFTLVANSGTGEILYTAAADQTNITVSAPASVTVASGTQYYIATKQTGYASFYGTETGTCYRVVSPYASAFPSSVDYGDTVSASLGILQLVKN